MSYSQQITAALQQHIGTHSKEIIRSIYGDFDAWNDANIIPGVKNEITLTSLKIANLIKPYSTTFSPTTDAIQFKPRTMSVKRGKAELTVYPEDYRYTYLAQFQKKGMLRTPDELPAAQFIMEDIVSKVKEEINSKVAYFGEYDPVGTGAVDIADGWGTVLDDMITAGDVIPVTTGAFSSSTAYTKMIQLWRSIPETFRVKAAKLQAFMSLETYEMIEDELETQGYNTGRGDDMLGPKYLRKTNGLLELKPVSWMAGSDRVFITPAENLCILSDSTDEDLNQIIVTQQHYTADLSITFAIGFDFATNMIWCNDQA